MFRYLQTHDIMAYTERRTMRPVTVHMRAGSTGKAAVNELCLNPRHWRSRIDGITLRGDVMVVNCRPCRILYARMWRDLGLTEYDYPKTDSGPLCNASESGYLDSRSEEHTSELQSLRH